MKIGHEKFATFLYEKSISITPKLIPTPIERLNKSGIKMDRKILAEIAYDNPEAFKTIVKKAQSALN